jgi:hypothetical protein
MVRSLLVATAIAALSVSGAASAQDPFHYGYYGPSPVVTYYHAPPSPFVYFDAAPAVSYYSPYSASYYGAPVVGYAPGYFYGPSPYYYGARKVVVRSRAFYRGQPVRNAIRALAP